mmetsp:Transcript_1105/g.2234  ORF Transcript_1105/g.2234 Transcript_1105/m.2234 type:complete len:349 (+) Transcript_1105:169-1215(+)
MSTAKKQITVVPEVTSHEGSATAAPSRAEVPKGHSQNGAGKTPTTHREPGERAERGQTKILSIGESQRIQKKLERGKKGPRKVSLYKQTKGVGASQYKRPKEDESPSKPSCLWSSSLPVRKRLRWATIRYPGMGAIPYDDAVVYQLPLELRPKDVKCFWDRFHWLRGDRPTVRIEKLIEMFHQDSELEFYLRVFGASNSIDSTSSHSSRSSSKGPSRAQRELEARKELALMPFIVCYWNFCSLSKFGLMRFVFQTFAEPGTGILGLNEVEQLISGVFGSKDANISRAAMSAKKMINDVINTKASRVIGVTPDGRCVAYSTRTWVGGWVGKWGEHGHPSTSLDATHQLL